MVSNLLNISFFAYWTNKTKYINKNYIEKIQKQKLINKYINIKKYIKKYIERNTEKYIKIIQKNI